MLDFDDHNSLLPLATSDLTVASIADSLVPQTDEPPTNEEEEIIAAVDEVLLMTILMINDFFSEIHSF
jgi:hypothetical protein